MKQITRIVLLVLLALVLLLAAALGIFSYRNLYWYDKNQRSIKRAGAIERQVTLPSGSVINYGEGPSDKPALLLIHGQMGAWEDYADLLPELSQNWHVYAVDVYGHGQSSHDPSRYYLDVNGDDLIWFIDQVIGEKLLGGESRVSPGLGRPLDIPFAPCFLPFVIVDLAHVFSLFRVVSHAATCRAYAPGGRREGFPFLV